MIMSNQRVPGTMTSGDRKRSRRKRKGPRQAGSPGSGTSRECRGGHKAFDRLAYAVRTSAPIRSARRLFYAMASCLKERPPARVRPGRRRRREPIKFVREKSPYVETPRRSTALALSRPPPPSDSWAPLLRARSTPYIGYDYRVTGTFLESPRLVEMRRLFEECRARGNSDLWCPEDKREWFESDPGFMLWAGQTSGVGVLAVSPRRDLPPLFACKIGTYDLSRAMHHRSEQRLSIASMVYEHLLGLAEFLPPLEDGTGAEVYLAPTGPLFSP